MDDVTANQVGTVEVLVMRVYPIDPNAGDNPLATTVVVQPGVYPVYREFDAYYWMMSGRVNSRGSRKFGDGLFTLSESDRAVGPEVRFPSRMFGIEEFREFLAEPTCAEGNNQRLRFTLTEELPVASAPETGDPS